VDAWGAYLTLLSRFSTRAPGTGREPNVRGRSTQPMTHALVALAQARAGIEPTGRGRVATRWLMRNHDLDRDGRSGWGLPFAWDAFGDGVGAAGTVNPPNHPYTITTAWALEALAAAAEAGWMSATQRAGAARLCTTVARRWVAESSTRGSPSFFWYSPHQVDAMFCPNVSSMMAGALQTAHGSGLVADEDGGVRAFVDAAVDAIVGIAGSPNGVLPSWPYLVAGEPPRPNDAVHHAYTVWGLERYREADGGRAIPWSTDTAAASCAAFLAGERALEVPVGVAQEGAHPARLWGVGMCLAVTARWGATRDATRFANIAGAYDGPGGPRIRPDAPATSVYPRHVAHLLLGLAELARRQPEGNVRVSSG
jgi:hypothetical protein